MTERRRGDDRDSPERIQHQQVGIAGDDQIGVAVHREYRKFVVLRIPTRGNALVTRSAAANIWRSLAAKNGTFSNARSPQDVKNFLLRGGCFEQAAEFLHPSEDHPGHDNALKAALTKTFVSTTIFIRDIRGAEALPGISLMVISVQAGTVEPL